MTLRFRLAVAGGLMLGVLGLVGYLLVQAVWAAQVKQIDQQIRAAVPIVASSFDGSDLVPRYSAPATGNGGAPGGSSLSDFYIATVGGEHRTVQLAPDIAGGQAPRAPAGAPQSVGSSRPVTVGSLSGSQRWRAVLVEIGAQRTVLIAQSLARVDATTAWMRWTMLLAGAFVLVVLSAGGYWVERLGLRPIAQVAGVAAAISAGERSRRVDAMRRSRSEASQLATAFNIMLDEQEASQDRLRQFVADASHELRTPVSAIRGFAELWSQGDLRSGAALDEAMRRIGQEGRRMTDLVEDLLLLARLEENRPARPLEVDLVSLVRDAELDASATHPSRDLRCRATGSVIVHGDEAGLRQVVANLLQNALVHTPSSASVMLSASEVDGRAVLEVVDTGPGMPPAEAARAFDRFWRSDSSRTRTGSGLGLPIVAAIVAAHDGDVAFDTSPERGTTVRVALPRFPAHSKPATNAEGGASLEAEGGDHAEHRAGCTNADPSTWFGGSQP